MGKIIKSVGNAVGGVLGGMTGSSAYKKQAKAMKEANRIAQAQAKQAEQQINAANAKTPDIDTIRADNAEGVGTTMLTGAGGAEVDETNKKRRTLLGA